MAIETERDPRLYAAFASVMNSTVERTLMPLVSLR